MFSGNYTQHTGVSDPRGREGELSLPFCQRQQEQEGAPYSTVWFSHSVVRSPEYGTLKLADCGLHKEEYRQAVGRARQRVFQRIGPNAVWRNEYLPS